MAIFHHQLANLFRGDGAAPVALIPVLPYVFTVILLAGFFGRAIPPKALGTPYVKEH